MTVTEAFSPADWYQLADGRWVAVIVPVVEYDPRTLVDRTVTLSGVAYLVQEFVIPTDNPTGRAFGLLVGEPLGGS